jgi:lipoyl(octanoyl) transferase
VIGDLAAARQAGAPGIYVDGAKIAALGLRVKHGCTYHGLAFNVDMDLAPFAAINPCGYAGMRVTQCRDLGVKLSPPQAGQALVQALLETIYS